MQADEIPYDVVEAASRFWSNVQPTGFCWEWTAQRSTSGYGRFWLGGKRHQAHRIAHLLLLGPIPEGHDVDHLCLNKACVNPDHLEPVTRAENTRRARALVNRFVINQKARTHCKGGHEFSEENTAIRPSDGARICRACARDAHRRHRSKAAVKQARRSTCPHCGCPISLGSLAKHIARKHATPAPAGQGGGEGA